jgi:hypothetical protein
MRRRLSIALTLLAGAGLMCASPASALSVSTEQVTGTAGSAAGGAVGGPLGGFVGGVAGRAIGRLIQKKKEQARGPQVQPLPPEPVIDTGGEPLAPDPAQVQIGELDTTPPALIERGPAAAEQHYAAAPGTLDYQYQRMRAGLPSDGGG